MIIEQALKDDLKEILELQKLAYRSEAEIYNDYSIPPLTQTLDEVKEDFSFQVFLKIMINNIIIGSVRAFKEDDTCYIGRLIVHPNFQNQGIETMLLKEIEAKIDDVKRYELFTGHKSEKNLYLYQKLGYRQFRTEVIHENLHMIYLGKKREKNKLKILRIYLISRGSCKGPVIPYFSAHFNIYFFLCSRVMSKRINAGIIKIAIKIGITGHVRRNIRFIPSRSNLSALPSQRYIKNV